MDTVTLKEVIDKAIDNYLYEKEPKKLYQAVRHLPLAGGKRLRPIIACLSCEATGGNIMEAVPLAVSLEIIHTFTLVHDDIMDRDEERRGLPSVHKLFGETTAILAGDTLFAKAFEIASYTKNDEIAKQILRHLAFMSRDICEGQQLDISYEDSEFIEEHQFFEVIEKKTAKMFEYSALCGAIVGSGTVEQQEALRLFGRNLGLSFQIWDDCLDVIGENIGKPVGSDIREGKRTLLYLYAYQHVDDKSWLKTYGNKKATKKDITGIIKLFEDSGTIDYVQEKALKLSQDAKDHLKIIPECQAKDILLEIADFSVTRNK